MTAAIALELALVLALIFVNGFFAMAEMALVAARKQRLRVLAEAGNGRAKLCLKLLKRPERFLSAVQIGITLAGVLASAYGGATLAASLAQALRTVPVLAAHAQTVALTAVVVPLTVLTLICGELVPKRLAMARPETLAMFAAPVMRGLMVASRPVIAFLGLATRACLHLFGLGGATEPAVTEEDIRGLLREGARTGVLEHAERDIIERLLRLTDRPLDVIMTHRSRVDWLDIDAPEVETLARILASPHTRYPVCRGDFTEVLGIARAKDILAARLRDGRLALAAHMDPPQYLPETMRGLDLLARFKTAPRLHLALVVDEYGDVVGVVTAADVFEDMVGDLPGLSGSGDPAVVRRADGSLLLDGGTPMDEVAAAMGLAQPWPEELAGTTLAGYVLDRLGRLPAVGETFTALGATFEVVDMDGRRIDRVLLVPGVGSQAPRPPGS